MYMGVCSALMFFGGWIVEDIDHHTYTYILRREQLDSTYAGLYNYASYMYDSNTVLLTYLMVMFSNLRNSVWFV